MAEDLTQECWRCFEDASKHPESSFYPSAVSDNPVTAGKCSIAPNVGWQRPCCHHNHLQEGVIWPEQKGLSLHAPCTPLKGVVSMESYCFCNQLQSKQDSSPMPSHNRSMCCGWRLGTRLLIALQELGQPHAMPATLSLPHPLSTTNGTGPLTALNYQQLALQYFCTASQCGISFIMHPHKKYSCSFLKS